MLYAWLSLKNFLLPLAADSGKVFAIADSEWKDEAKENDQN